MDKLLINVDVPSIGKSYDMFIPKQIMVHEVLELIKNAVYEMSSGVFMKSSDNVLCFKSDGSIVDINKSVSKSGIKNGEALFIV